MGTQAAGLIRDTHGLVTVRNRKGLEKASCECYAIIPLSSTDCDSKRPQVRLAADCQLPGRPVPGLGRFPTRSSPLKTEA